MNTEECISFLKNLGYKITPPTNIPPAKQTGGYKVETTEGPFFMEGFEGEEIEIKEAYSNAGKTVLSVTFQPDFFALT